MTICSDHCWPSAGTHKKKDSSKSDQANTYINISWSMLQPSVWDRTIYANASNQNKQRRSIFGKSLAPQHSRCIVRPWTNYLSAGSTINPFWAEWCNDHVLERMVRRFLHDIVYFDWARFDNSANAIRMVGTCIATHGCLCFILCFRDVDRSESGFWGTTGITSENYLTTNNRCVIRSITGGWPPILWRPDHTIKSSEIDWVYERNLCFFCLV